MKEETKKMRRRRKRKRHLSRICLICWTIIPSAAVIALLLDGIGVYSFNTERLLIMGACVLIVLLPFFSEISIKNVSLKKENESK